MTTPDDPYAMPEQPGGPPTPPPMPPQPGYGAPPSPQPGYGAPPPGYGAPPPGYGQPEYGAPAPSAGGMAELAPWGTRVVAALIDAAIILAAQLVIGVISRNLGQLVGIGLEVYFAYLVGTRGSSPGKQVMKIKVVRDADGQLVGFGTAVLRWLAHIVDVITLGIGFLWPLWDAKKQTFADKIVGTVVIRG